MEMVAVKDTGTMLEEYNDPIGSTIDKINEKNLKENQSNPAENISNNDNSDNVTPRLPDIKIVSLKVSDPISEKYFDKGPVLFGKF